jgi:hypothetical protein
MKQVNKEEIKENIKIRKEDNEIKQIIDIEMRKKYI